MIPRMPSDPSSSRSGDGPAPDAGQPSALPDAARCDRRESIRRSRRCGCGASRSDRRNGSRASRRAWRTRTTGGSAEASGHAAAADLRARAHSTPAWMRAARDRRSTSMTRSSRAQVDADGAAVVVADVALDTTDHRRSTAIGDGGDVRVAAPVEERDDVVFVARDRDYIRRMREVTMQRRATRHGRTCHRCARPARTDRR